MKFNFIIFKAILFISVTFSLVSCTNETSENVTISIVNHLDQDRISETIEINATDLQPLIRLYGLDDIIVEDISSGEILRTQWLDSIDNTSKAKLLFQTDIAANAIKEFVIRKIDSTESKPVSEIMTFSRIVPERIDDYTWENDRVAFRTYGPEAQRLVDDDEPGGTCSSGMDAWLKRVNYPIIDKWYKNMEISSYHVDSGEGYDPYHVGTSRGIGGIGIWIKDSLYTSKNFTDFKTITTGPIRTVFELTYAPWNVDGNMVKETKRISLDLGTNLTHYESTVTNNEEISNITLGITLHDNLGETKVEEKKGYFRYWEPIDDSELGLGIVLDPEYIKGYKKNLPGYKDGNQLLIMTQPKDNKVIYYAGFGWLKSGQFKNKIEWDSYLEHKSACIQSPLEINIK